MNFKIHKTECHILKIMLIYYLKKKNFNYSSETTTEDLKDTGLQSFYCSFLLLSKYKI